MKDGFNRELWAELAEETPDPLSAQQGLERLLEALDPAARDRFLERPEALRQMAWFMAASPGLVPFLARHPDAAVGLWLEGEAASPDRAAEERRAFFSRCRAAADPDELGRLIARFRNAHMIRLYSQEILAMRSPREIWREWSEVAACCLQGAIDGCRGRLPGEGEGIELAAIGMGKLGGEELNYGSDIDLIFLYDHSRALDPDTAHQWAVHWATRVTAVLQRATEEGPAFRVDLGLRPGGKDGAVVQTLEACEIYYQSQAVTWERLALIKARPVAGHPGLGAAFVEMVEPFVFRRYLDYGSLEDIRALKDRIQRQVRRRRPHPLDVKMGRGGIREVEFLAQTLQIIYGGKMPALRTRGTPETLAALEAAGLLAPEECAALLEANAFLRGVEHRLQMIHHRQTHRLPANERERIRIAGLMGYRGAGCVEAFQQVLLTHMDRVHGAFEGLLAAPGREAAAGGQAREEEILAHLDDEEVGARLLERAGFQQPAAVRETLGRIVGERFPAHRSPRARRTLHRLLPRILSLLRETPRPDLTLFRLEPFLEAIGPRGGYYALLEENPETLAQLVSLCGQSALLARWLAAHLEAVDALVDRGHYRPRRGKAELLEEFSGGLRGLGDPEERLGRLREIRAQEILRIGAADLWGGLDPLGVGEELTNLAEVFLEVTAREVLRAAGHDPEAPGVPLSIVGLGTLGGRELSYRSDLDLAFLFYEGSGWRPPKGASRVEHLTRLGQRILSWLTMPTRGGPGWAVDVRLRPSGTRGPLMVSLSSFQQYHQRLGRAWERQALLKARPCAGDPETGERVMETVCRILSESPPLDPDELHEMRIRIERERGFATPDDAFHLKLGAGGILDVEFLVQYHQLRRWASDSGVRTPTTAELIETLRQIGILGGDEGRVLLEAHRLFKGVENRLGLVLDRQGTDRPCTWEEIEGLGPPQAMPWAPRPKPGEGPAAVLKRVMAQVRRIYLRHLRASS